MDMPIQVNVSQDVLSVATNIVRMLRNLCCNNKSNQMTIVDSHLLPMVLQFPFYN